MAKSAGTIMVMSGDEILMDYMSALGPIDAQIQFEGKQFSAEALIKGFEKIKDESDQTKSLNRAYIPMLQRISPGDLQHAQNALDFAKDLVATWLSSYKFKNWNVHRTHNPGSPVGQDEKVARASKVAEDLCNHSAWKTHGRSIRIQDLHAIGVEVIDFGQVPDLADAIKTLSRTIANDVRFHEYLQGDRNTDVSDNEIFGKSNEPAGADSRGYGASRRCCSWGTM